MTGEPITFAGYALREKLRDEPSGAAYTAVDAQGRPFEVHLLAREHEARAEVATRWLQAAEQLRRAGSRRIIRVLAVGRERGRTFYVSGTAGDTLDRWLQSRAALHYSDAVAIGRQAAEGLRRAHQLGLALWDLRPSALAFNHRDGVRLTSWFAAPPASDASSPFLAPEVVSGRFDQRADVYALGVLLLQMLLDREPSREDVRSPMFVAETPPWLRDLVQSCVAADPRMRPQTAEAVLAALDAGGRAPRGSAAPAPGTARVATAAVATPAPASRRLPIAAPSRRALVPAAVAAVVLALVAAAGATAAWWFVLRDEAEAIKCGVKGDAAFCAFADEARRAVEAGDDTWLRSSVVITSECGVSAGALASEGTCVPLNALSVPTGLRLFGLIYPLAHVFNADAANGPALLFGNQPGVSRQDGLMLMLRRDRDRYRVMHVISMTPLTMRITLGAEQVIAWPGGASVDPAWRPSGSGAATPTAGRGPTATSTSETPTPAPRPAQAVSAVVTNTAPQTCLFQRNTPELSFTNEIQCIPEGERVTILRGPVAGGTYEGQSDWYLARAPDGREGYMAGKYLLLSAKTLQVHASASDGITLLNIDAVDIAPDGDIILQVSAIVESPSRLIWTTDRNRTDILLIDGVGRQAVFKDAGGFFGRDLDPGFSLGQRLPGWLRFGATEPNYRGQLTLQYRSHPHVTFAFEP